MARRIGSKVSSVIVAALRTTVLVTQYTYRHFGAFIGQRREGKAILQWAFRRIAARGVPAIFLSAGRKATGSNAFDSGQAVR
jgi:hypothetical protein